MSSNNDLSFNKDVIELIVKRKQKDDSINRILKIDIKPAVDKGENFTSTLLRYSMEVLLGSGEQVRKHLIVKSLPSWEHVAAFFIELNFFKNEIAAYKAMERMKILMDEFHDRRETLWCKMIHYKPYNKLYLEDLQDLDYYVLDRCVPVDWLHCIMVIKSLGRIHAMSAALINRSVFQPGDFDTYMFAKRKLFKLSQWRWMYIMEQVVRSTWEEKWKPLADLLKKSLEVMLDLMETSIEVNNEKFNVINVGDCWTNNLMFKHIEGTNIPCALKFIDLQMTHYNTIGWDLTYFIYSSMPPSLRREKYSDILKIYYQSLTENLQFFAYPKNKLPSFSMVMDEMERMKFYGFITLCSIYPWTTSDLENTYDFAITISNPDKFELGLNKYVLHSQKYRQEVEEDFLNFMKGDLMEFFERYSTGLTG